MGMATSAKDLGRKVEIQLHIGALAAKGMIERKGLSKVRRLDVNMLCGSKSNVHAICCR